MVVEGSLGRFSGGIVKLKCEGQKRVTWLKREEKECSNIGSLHKCQEEETGKMPLRT